MSRCLTTWGMGTADKEKIVSDMARFTDGVIQLDKDSLQLDNGQRNGTTNSAIARDSMQADYQNKKKRRKKK